MPYSPGSLTTQAKARRTARSFARLLGGVINTTISQAPLTFVEVQHAGEPFIGFVAHVADGLPAPLPLVNDRYLYYYHRLGLRRPERYLTTLETRYTYQETDDPGSWVFRYEYVREPESGYAYPNAHLHVNAPAPKNYLGARAFPELHLPTGRVTIEALVRHLMSEHGIQPVSTKWEEAVADAEKAWREIQRRRMANPAPPQPLSAD